MTETDLHKEWKKFAEAIGGSVSQSKASYFNPDNTYHIKTSSEEVFLTWANQPERGRGAQVKIQSVFRFNLRDASHAYLKVSPKDFISGVLSVWSKNRRKTGDPELDREYIVLANEQVPFSTVVNQLQRFYQQNRHKSFFINTEKESVTPALVIQVNELLIQTEDLYFFYEFGKSLAEVMRSGV